MQIRSENDLKLAYETINSFKEMMPMAQKPDAALEYIKELKRDIRGFFRKEKEKLQRRLVKDNAELGTAKKITEENNKAIAKLKADIYKLKANEVPEELIKEMYNMAYDKEAEMIEKMEETADQMADASIAGEDVQKFAEDYKAQKEKRNRYAKMMDTLDARERRMQERK